MGVLRVGYWRTGERPEVSLKFEAWDDENAELTEILIDGEDVTDVLPRHVKSGLEDFKDSVDLERVDQ